MAQIQQSLVLSLVNEIEKRRHSHEKHILSVNTESQLSETDNKSKNQMASPSDQQPNTLTLPCRLPLLTQQEIQNIQIQRQKMILSLNEIWTVSASPSSSPRKPPPTPINEILPDDDLPWIDDTSEPATPNKRTKTTPKRTTTLFKEIPILPKPKVEPTTRPPKETYPAPPNDVQVTLVQLQTSDWLIEERILQCLHLKSRRKFLIVCYSLLAFLGCILFILLIWLLILKL